MKESPMETKGPSDWQAPLPCIALTERTALQRSVARRLSLFLLTFLVLVGFTPWQQNVRGTGRVIAHIPQERQQTIEATIEGRVLVWHVQEGSQVTAGSLIGEISDYDADLPQRIRSELETVDHRIAAIQSRIQALEQQKVLAENSREMALLGADARIRMAEERLQASGHLLAASRAALETTQLNKERQTLLEQKGLASRRTLELANLDKTQKKTDMDRAEAAYKAASNEVEAIRADREKVLADTGGMVEKTRSDVAKGREELQYAEAEKLKIQTRYARQNTQKIVAPRDGTILRLLANPGAEVVKPGDAVAVLVPSTEQRAVELWIDGNDAPLIDSGRKVRLQFEGYPAIQFSGWPETAVGTFGGEVSLIDASDNGKGDFRLLITPDHSDEPWPEGRFIRQGVRVNGWVLLNKVSLGYELWRNFNGFPPLLQDKKG